MIRSQPPLRRALIVALALGACGRPPDLGEASAPSLAPQAESTAIEILASALPGDGACGSLHQRVDTAVATAQDLYDQGIACLGTFDWARAGRSFRGALEADPRLAMAHAGLARAFLGLEAPVEALRQAQLAMELATPRTAAYDRAFIRATVLQLEAVTQARRPDGLLRYREALDGFLEDFPADPHGLALRGHAENRPDDWGQGGADGSARWYRAALRADPAFFPAHHYLAHALENQGKHEPALEHARRFAALAPEAPHAHHMVAHTAPRLGRWQVALGALERADTLHQERFATGEIAPEEDWHYPHNLRLMASVALHQGERHRAREAFRSTFELAIPGHRGGFYCGPFLEFLLLEGDYEAALAAAASCLDRPSRLARVLGHGYRGEALAGLGRLAEARSERDKATSASRELFDQLGPVSTERTTAAFAQRSLAVLEGKLLYLGGNRESGIKWLEALAAELTEGHSFDAWAAAQTRLRELESWATAQGAPDLAERMEAYLLGLEDSLGEVKVASLEESPGSCH